MKKPSLSSESRGQKLEPERVSLLRSARRVVIKLGTNVVAEPDGSLSAARLEPLAASVAQLRRSGIQVVLVSSGAVGLGRGRLGLHRTRTGDLVTRQACAALGQALLMDGYQRLFSAYDVNIAQVLLTEDDFTERRRSANLRHTIEKLLKLGVVPIINENDTVSTTELEYVPKGTKARIFSDNDRLSALVASKLDANALVLLTNVPGLLRLSRKTGVAPASVPSRRLRVRSDKPMLCGRDALTTAGADASATPEQPERERMLIPLVQAITPELKALAAGPSQGGRGGMMTKLEAAEIATRAGAIVVIADGTKPDTLERIFKGEPLGTAFIPASRMPGKRRWIAYAADVRGRVVVNAGARAAITGSKASLLWSGVIKVERRFNSMDVISVADPEGHEFARGIANHGSAEAELLAATAAPRDGRPSAGKAVVLVKRDNIVVFEE